MLRVLTFMWIHKPVLSCVHSHKTSRCLSTSLCSLQVYGVQNAWVRRQEAAKVGRGSDLDRFSELRPFGLWQCMALIWGVLKSDVIRL